MTSINLFGDEFADLSLSGLDGVPDLNSYQWICVSSSAGKDSMTALRRVVQEADKVGFPRDRIVVAHADLGRFEWDGAKELALEQAEHYGLRTEVVKRTKGNDLLVKMQERFEAGKAPSWPSPQVRWCTSDFKRGPLRTVYTKLSKETRSQQKPNQKRQVRVLAVMGLRAQESPGRAELVEYTSVEACSNPRKHVDLWLPIHKWETKDVWKDIKQSGVRYHWVYDKGLPRLSCSFCIYAPEAALKVAAALRPELLEEYVVMEKKTGFTFKQDLSLVQLQAEMKEASPTQLVVPDWEM